MAETPGIDPLWGTAIGAGTDLLSGYLSSRSQQKAQKKAQKYSDQERLAAFRFLKEGRGRDALGANLERSALKAAHAQELGGFAGAKKALDLGAIQAREIARAQGKVNQADVEQSAVSSGTLGGSTAIQQFTGVGDATTAQLQAVDMQLAQAFADLGLQESETLGRQGRELTGLQTRERDIQREYDAMLAELAPRGYGGPLQFTSGFGQLLNPKLAAKNVRPVY